MSDQPDFDPESDAEIEPLDDALDDAPEPARDVCWRCGKLIDTGLAPCPYCRARPRSTTAFAPARTTIDDGGQPLVRTLVVFACLLATSIIAGVVMAVAAVANDEKVAEQVHLDLDAILVLDAVDTVLVLGALFWVGRPRPSAPVSAMRRLAVWAAAAPALVAAVAVNHLYHEWLIKAFDLEIITDRIVQEQGASFVLVLSFCIQPAIIEELFFRYLALGALRGVMGTHAAVGTAAVMFGIAHIGVPLSIPILMLLGVFFGYARVWSGGILLPMLLHGAHNAIVLFVFKAS